MTTATIAEPERASTVREKAVDAVRQATHFSHEARLLKSLATDTVEDAVHASKQAIKTVRRRAQDLADVRHEIAHQVRREPFKAVGFAFAVGTFLGLIAGRIGRPRTPCGQKHGDQP